MRARRIRSPGRELWVEVLARHPGASFFQTPVYAEIAEGTLGTPCVLFAFECADGARAVVPAFAIRTGWLRRNFAVPGGGLPGGIVSEAPLTPARADAVLKGLAQIPSATFHLSLDPRDLPRLPAAPERTPRRDRFFILDLDGGYERLHREAFAKDFREQCRKSARRGIRVAWEAGRAAFVEFGHLHRRAAQAWEPTSRKPLAFFAACARAAGLPGSSIRLALARSESHDGAAVAGLLLVRYGDTVTCWLAAMDRGARRLAPSAAVYRFAIEWASSAGGARFLLGASGGIASIEAFKRSLGATATEAVTSLEVRGTAREWIRRTRQVAASVRPAASL